MPSALSVAQAVADLQNSALTGAIIKSISGVELQGVVCLVDERPAERGLNG